jgi:alkylhydroperoxidase/carboxymuconolactone decarboxylase family protein YurZ
MTGAEELLRRLAGNDERCLERALDPEARGAWALDRETRALVQFAALLALDASTASLRWAVDQAAASGVDDGTLIDVLLAVGAASAAAHAAANAPRLAAALDLETTEAEEPPTPDATGRAGRRSSPGRPLPNGTRRPACDRRREPAS